MTASWYETSLPTLLCQYRLEDIYNADGFGIFYQYLPNKTFYFDKSDKCSGGKHSKIRFFFLYLRFLSQPFTNHSEGGGYFLIPHYHFHPLHRHLYIDRAITAESSPLHIGSSRTRTGNLWFPSAIH